MPISTSFALGSNVWARAISKKRSDVDVFVVGIIKPVKAGHGLVNSLHILTHTAHPHLLHTYPALSSAFGSTSDRPVRKLKK